MWNPLLDASPVVRIEPRSEDDAAPLVSDESREPIENSTGDPVRRIVRMSWVLDSEPVEQAQPVRIAVEGPVQMILRRRR